MESRSSKPKLKFIKYANTQMDAISEGCGRIVLRSQSTGGCGLRRSCIPSVRHGHSDGPDAGDWSPRGGWFGSEQGAGKRPSVGTSVSRLFRLPPSWGVLPPPREAPLSWPCDVYTVPSIQPRIGRYPLVQSCYVSPVELGQPTYVTFPVYGHYLAGTPAEEATSL